jgi:kynurenine formamidase
VIADIVSAIRGSQLEIIDLTAPLTDSTPVLRLPEPFANTINFQLEEISRYDERGPRWYWNNIHTGEHTGTHVDAPNHWASGRDGIDVSQIPLRSLIAPAVVLDASDRVSDNADFLLEIEDVVAWQSEHGPLPDGGWLLFRTGWDARSTDQAEFLNVDDTGSHTPRGVAGVRPLVGPGVPDRRARGGDGGHRRGPRP